MPHGGRGEGMQSLEGPRLPASLEMQGWGVGGLQLCDLREVSPPRPVLFINGDIESCSQGMRKRKELDRRYKAQRKWEGLCQWFSKCGLGITVVPGALSGDS